VTVVWRKTWSLFESTIIIPVNSIFGLAVCGHLFMPKLEVRKMILINLNLTLNIRNIGSKPSEGEVADLQVDSNTGKKDSTGTTGYLPWLGIGWVAIKAFFGL
jgi:hypothetical protein